jgi:predicted AAA+ superfamily ATPase
VTLTGPRQSGKTTLARMVFRGKRYASLENPDLREYARSDPRGFIAEHQDGAIFDEIQRAPDLLSYLQQEVDTNPAPGRFVLTGSHNLQMLRGVSQSLAGRTALVTLLPLAREEVERFPTPPLDLVASLLCGGYPAILDRSIPASEWLADYATTYIERDVRQLLGVADINAFYRFVQLAAGRSAQLLNLASLAADAGISHNTASAWLGVLEASYLVFRLPSYHRNVGKRLVKAPKLHFFDSGLLCFLLGIRTPAQLGQHPLRGAVFESWVASELLKAQVHHGLPPDLYYYRDQHGCELDLIHEGAEHVLLVECKSGATVAADFFRNLTRVAPLLGPVVAPRPVVSAVVYGGSQSQKRAVGRLVPWHAVPALARAQFQVGTKTSNS